MSSFKNDGYLIGQLAIEKEQEKAKKGNRKLTFLIAPLITEIERDGYFSIHNFGNSQSLRLQRGMGETWIDVLLIWDNQNLGWNIQPPRKPKRFTQSHFVPAGKIDTSTIVLGKQILFPVLRYLKKTEIWNHILNKHEFLVINTEFTIRKNASLGRKELNTNLKNELSKFYN